MRINLQPVVVIITDANIPVVINSWKIAIPVLARIVVKFLAQQKFVMDVLVYNAMKVLYA
jgi:acyl-CoA reductase-like NAD-dependent aldehyde dehydrogenase